MRTFESFMNDREDSFAASSAQPSQLALSEHLFLPMIAQSKHLFPGILRQLKQTQPLGHSV